MGHTLLKKSDGVRQKMVYYAPDDVREFIQAQAKCKGLSQSEIVVQTIQESWDFKRKDKHVKN